MGISSSEILSDPSSVTSNLCLDEVCFLCLEKPALQVRCTKKCALVVCVECFQFRDLRLCPYGHPYKQTHPYKKMCLDLFQSMLMAIAIDVSIYLIFHSTMDEVHSLFRGIREIIYTFGTLTLFDIGFCILIFTIISIS